LSESSSNPIEKLAYTIKADAWKASGTTSGDGKIYWYQSNDSSAPNLVTFAYSGATASTYIGHRGTYIADRGDITNAITLTCNGQTQLGFCYDPAESNPLGDTYYYSGVLSNDSTNNTIRKILYNGYPTNKELLDQTGLSPDTLWYQTQQALWHIQNGRDGTGNLDLYNFLLGNEPSVTINGVTVTRRNPPDDYVMYCYWAPNRQRIVVTEEPLLVNLSGTKTWVGDDENTRPTSVQMQLYKRVGGIESPVLKDGALVTFSATAANNWTYQFSNMPRYENEEIIQYFVRELNVPDGYTAKVDGMNITNTKISSQKFALTLKKLVDGRFANKNKAFAFTITLKDENGSNVNDSFDVETSSDVSSSSISNGKITFTDGTAKVDLTHEQEITIKALPKGYTYEIQEELEGNELYIKNISVNDAAVSGQSEGNTGVRTVNQDETVTYTNKSNDDIAQTGLRTDFAPNVIFLTLTLLLGGLLFIMSFKTRKNAKR
jgi:TQXA domain-containing protein